MRAWYVWVFACLLILTALPTAVADRGMIVPENTSVFEPGQNAIVAWNGRSEVLILSTDVQASENTWALELLPLPSQPARPTAGNFYSFYTIQDLMMRYAENVYVFRGLEIPDVTPLEILFQENIGAHHITVFKINNVSQLINFAKNLIAESEFVGEVAWNELESLVVAYLEREINYWVLDLIDLSDYQMSREPIIYIFESDYLYFPLEISSLASGETEITLFTLTNDKLDASSVEAAGFSIASFTADGEKVLIEFEVSENELQQISPRVAELFEGVAWLTALTYAGSLEDLRGDIMFSAAPPEAVNQLLAAAWAAAIVLVLLVIFAIIYKLSPYYKSSRKH